LTFGYGITILRLADLEDTWGYMPAKKSPGKSTKKAAAQKKTSGPLKSAASSKASTKITKKASGKSLEGKQKTKAGKNTSSKATSSKRAKKAASKLDFIHFRSLKI
jgi:hypothetical protein